jgi:hypothetical protein
VPFSWRNFFSPQSVEEPTQLTHRSFPTLSATILKQPDNNMSKCVIPEACLGFAGPEDRVISLNVPLERDDRRNSSYHSFDIEYDSGQPDMLTIRLFELDQHGFVSTALQSTLFPILLLADLVNRRKATAEEVADWKSVADED